MPEEEKIERYWREFNPVELSDETRRIAQQCTNADEINEELLRRFDYPFHVIAKFDETGRFVEGSMWSKLGRAVNF